MVKETAREGKVGSKRQGTEKKLELRREEISRGWAIKEYEEPVQR